MILDSLENSKRIECIHPLFKQAFDYVKSTDFSKMEDGKYDIADAGFTVSIASLFGKEKSEAAIETQIYRYPIPLIGRRENRMETGRSITRGVRSIQRGARYRLLYRQTYRLYENLSRTIRHLFPGRRARPGYRPREYPEGGYQDPGPIVSNPICSARIIS
jgi:hypothetical protein